MPPVELRQFSELVETLYEAGLDSDKWQDFCDGLNAALPGARIMLQGHDIRSRTNLGLLTSNYDPREAAEYLQYYQGINVWLPLMKTAPVARVLTDADVLDRQDLVRTEFWADYVRPLGDISAAVGTVLFREADRILVLTANYNWARQDRYRDKSRFLWALLTPHARRAFEIQRTIRGQKLVDRSYRQALDKVRNAVFLLDSRGRVSHLNAAAGALLRVGEVFFTDREKRLRAFDPQADRSIRTQIASISDRRYATLDGAVVLRPKSGARPSVATLLPFRPNIENTGLFGDFACGVVPIAMLTVVDAARDEARLRAALCASYGLTETEIEIAVLLHGGQSIHDCASLRGVSIHTVRNQVRSILEKTGTHRQSELVALTNTLA